MTISKSDKKARLSRLVKKLSPQGSIGDLREQLQTSTSEPATLESLSVNFPTVTPEEGLANAADALDVIQHGDRLDDLQGDALEAVIHTTLRPAIYIVNDRFDEPPEHWHSLGEADNRARIERSIPSIGRIELPGNMFLPYAGTGFVVGENLVMTNRHVAELFVHRVNQSEIRFRSGFRAEMNFFRECVVRSDEEERTLSVEKVVWIDRKWDMALLEVRGLGENQIPLPLSTTHPGDMESRDVVVIGYPGRDARGDTDVQNRIFEGDYGVKRLLPGKIGDFELTENYGRNVDALTHDASTLGGCSGSAVIHVATGEVVGLHFKGIYLETNYSVAAQSLSLEPPLVDAGLSFANRSSVEKRADAHVTRVTASSLPANLPSDSEREQASNAKMPKKFSQTSQDHPQKESMDNEIPLLTETAGRAIAVPTAPLPPEQLLGSSREGFSAGIIEWVGDFLRNVREALTLFTLEDELQNTIWYIEAHFPGQPPQSGSAVMLRLRKSRKTENVLLTCQHVVRNLKTGEYSRDIRCWRNNDGYNTKDFWIGKVSAISGSEQKEGFVAKVAGGKDWVVLTVDKPGQTTRTLPFAPGFARARFASRIPLVSRRFRLIGFPGGSATMARSVAKADVSNEFRMLRLDTNTGMIPLAGSESTGGGYSGAPYLKSNGRIVALHRQIRGTNNRPVGIDGKLIEAAIQDGWGWNVVNTNDKTPMRWLIRVLTFFLVLTAYYALWRTPALTIHAIEGKKLTYELPSSGYTVIPPKGSAQPKFDATKPPSIVEGRTFEWRKPIFQPRDPVDKYERAERFISTSAFRYRKWFLGIPLPAGTITVKVRHHKVFQDEQEFYDILSDDPFEEQLEWFQDPELRPLITIKFQSQVIDFTKSGFSAETFVETDPGKMKETPVDPEGATTKTIRLQLLTDRSVIQDDDRREYLLASKKDKPIKARQFTFKDVFISDAKLRVGPTDTWDVVLKPKD